MEIKPIKTKKQYEQWLQWADEQFDKKIKPNSALGEKLQVILILIKNYEDEHYAVPSMTRLNPMVFNYKGTG